MPSPPDAAAAANLATRIALLMVAGFVFIIFGLAGAHFFRRPLVGQGVRFRLHQAASILFAIVHLVVIWEMPSLSVVSVLAAIVLYAIGLCLFLWTQDTTKAQPPFVEHADVDPEALIVWGPFKIVRHPFYVSYGIVWLAGVAATLNPWVALTAAIMIASYVVAARDEETAFLRTRFAAEYRGYRMRTGSCVPRPRQLLAGSLKVSLIVLFAIAAAIIMTAAIIFEIFTEEKGPGIFL